MYHMYPSPATGHLSDSRTHQLKHFSWVDGRVGGVVTQLAKPTRAKGE